MHWKIDDASAFHCFRKIYNTTRLFTNRKGSSYMLLLIYQLGVGTGEFIPQLDANIRPTKPTKEYTKNRPQLKKSTKLGRCKCLFALSVASSNNWVKSYRPGSSGSLSMGSWAPQARPEPRASYKAGICVHAAHTKCWAQFHRWYPLAAQRAEGGRAHRWHAPTLEFSPVQMGSNRSRRIGVNCWACCAKWQWKAVSRQLSYRARARKSDERDDWMSTERTWYCARWAHWCVASWTKV